MIGTEIIQKFRDENPEIDVNVIPDATLASWLTTGDLETCAKARLINKQSVSIPAVLNQKSYDLTSIDPLFFSIDEMPGGGVSRVGTDGLEKRLTKLTKAYLDNNNSQWRTASAGVPKYYFRYGKSIQVHPKPDATVASFNADIICLPTAFTNMGVMPFNQLAYLAPFHYSLVLYLQWRAKIKIGKMDEGTAAYALYQLYLQWMIKTIGGEKYDRIEFRPSGLPSVGYQR